MLRGLVMVAVGGALVCVTCIGAATSMGRIGWNVDDLHWSIGDSDDGGDVVTLNGSEKVITRTLPYAGSAEITISVPSEITYTQGPVAGITLSGPDKLVNLVKLDGTELKLDHHVHFSSTHDTLKIDITGPNLHDFTLESAESLAIQNLATDTLSVSIDGAGKLEAHGTAHTLKLEIDGAGDADLVNLGLTDAHIEINGLGNVTAGPTGDAHVEINGAGNVVLSKRPATLSQEINGGGHISQPDEPPEQKL